MTIVYTVGTTVQRLTIPEGTEIEKFISALLWQLGAMSPEEYTFVHVTDFNWHRTYNLSCTEEVHNA